MTEKNTQPEFEHKEEDGVSRRDMLKMTGVAAGLVALTSLVGVPAAIKKAKASEGGGGEHRWGMLIDINKCIGCHYCSYACQAINDLPEEQFYNVVTQETLPNGDSYFLSRPCMHCDNPPCVHVCPVGATYVREDGIVTMDYDLCIGCRYCEVACPYDARSFNWEKNTSDNPRVPDFGIPEVERRPRGVMEKCTFCEHRIDAGLERNLTPGIDAHATPACVVICPTGARVFGDLNDEESPISKELADIKTPLRLREELSTEPKVFYNPPREV